MKKLGDKQSEFCKKCKSKQKFEVSEISEYGESTECVIDVVTLKNYNS